MEWKQFEFSLACKEMLGRIEGYNLRFVLFNRDVKKTEIKLKQIKSYLTNTRKFAII